MKIKVLEKTVGCFPVQFDKGEWYDLFCAEDVALAGSHAKALRKNKEGKIVEKTREVVFNNRLIPLGVAIEVPKGCEAILAPRSSTFNKYGILQSNGIGVIDNSYKSDKDEWKMPIVALRAVNIPKGTRIAQFRIQPSQKATIWQKIKYLLSSRPRLVQVDSLDNPERGGFGEGTDNIK